MTDSPLDELAQAVADGRSPDWAAAEASAPTEHDRLLVRRLRRLGAIVAGARTPPAWTADAPEILPAGSTWARLRIIDSLGAGTFGVVYRAWDPSLDHEVALKVMRRRAPASSSSMVVEEGRLLARARHPNVVSVYGADCVDGHVGIWMELIRGQTLEQMLQQSGPVDARAAAQIGVDLCRALDAVHRAGFVHGDVKAANVMRGDDGRVVLMDFGAGREHAQTPSAGHLTGTPAYLAPEVLEGAPASAQSDIYGAGVVLYRLVTGGYPVNARSLADLRRQHAADQRGKLADARADVPASFSRAVDRALAPTPAARYVTARDLESELTLSLAPFRAGRSFSRWRGGVALGGVAIAALLALSGFGWWLHSGARGQRPADGLQVPQQVMGRPSRDGILFPYVDGHGRLHTWNAATGESRSIPDALTTGESAVFSAVSPRGDAVAYDAHRADRAWELRIRPLPDGPPRTVVARETAFEPIPMDWSSDGRQVLCTLEQRDGSRDLALVPADGTALKVIATFRGPKWDYASLSPGGQFVAVFDHSDHLSILAVDGRVRTSFHLTGRRPMWMPDGRHVLFGSPDGSSWMLPVMDGVATGAPSSTVLPRGYAAQAITGDGDLVATETTFSKEVYVSPFDPSTSPSIGPPSRVSPTRLGDHVGPSWSRDPRVLAFLDTRDLDHRAIIVRDLTSQTDRVVPTTLAAIGGRNPQWMPDGKSVVVYVTDPQDGTGFYRVDVSSGRSQPLVILRNPVSNEFQVSDGGRALLFVDAARGFVARDLASGHETTLLTTVVRTAFRVSREGSAIAFMETRTEENRQVQSLEVWTAQGGTRRVLDLAPGQAGQVQTWTPSGDILFTVPRPTDQQFEAGNELMSISPRGGAARDLGELANFNGANTIAISPDGRLLAYTESASRTTLHVTAAPIETATAHHGP